MVLLSKRNDHYQKNKRNNNKQLRNVQSCARAMLYNFFIYQCFKEKEKTSFMPLDTSRIRTKRERERQKSKSKQPFQAIL